MFLSLLFSGWVLVAETEADPAVLLETQELLSHCPARQQDWVARYADGTLARLGPVAGSGEVRDDAEIEACLRAGLRARPLPDGTLVRLRYDEATADIWETNVLGILNTLAGPDAGQCVALRFPVMPDGNLGVPEAVLDTTDPREAAILAAVWGYEKPLPPVPEALRQHYGEAVVLCVGAR